MDCDLTSPDRSAAYETKSLPEEPIPEPSILEEDEDEENSGVPVGQVTEEGFVMRTKEVRLHCI